MVTLPTSYIDYLADKDAGFVETVLPILEQSAAGQAHGVHVRLVPGGNQAFVDPSLPYGEIVEGID